MDYFIEFEDGSDGYLSHHGVLGMKWGVRNAETKARYASKGRSEGAKWRDSKRQAKQLNKLDKERAVNVGRISTAEGGAYNAKKAMKKAKASGNVKRAEKLQARSDNYQADFEKYSARQKEIMKQYNALGKKVLANGHELEMTMVPRSTLTTGEKAAQAGLIALQVLSPSPVAYYSNPTTIGVKFKARKERKVSKRPRAYFTKDSFR